MKNRWIARALKFTVFIALMIAGVGFLVMGLWNALIPQIFQNGPHITFWQAVGLLVLSRLLFAGFLRPWGWGVQKSRYWQKRWEKKLAAMSPEEREKIRQAYARRCGGRFMNWESRESQSQKEPVTE